MSVPNSQEICSLALNKCLLEKLPGFVEHLEPVIGKAGGRRFIEYPLGEQNSSLQGTVSMNDVVKRLDIVWKDLSKGTNALDRQSVEAVLNTVTKIQEKDNEANVKLKEKNILIRLFTAIRSFFGNIGFNRKDILESIEKAARANLAVLNSLSQNPETESTKKEAAHTIAEQEAKVEALILALSQLSSNNYAKTKQILENSANDIVCAAIRRSIITNQYGVFLATMSEDKFESVFRTAAKEARDSNDYQLFALLVSRSHMLCAKPKIIDIVKSAISGSKDKLEILRLEVNKNLSDDALINTYGFLLDAARP